MQMPLLTSSLLTYAERHFGDIEIVSRRTEGDIHRTTYQALSGRAKQLANALTQTGLAHGDRVGTLAWNGYRHMEIYYAVGGMGSIVHTINPRLYPEQIVYIINHAEDKVVMFDTTFLPLIEKIAALCPTVQSWVLMCDKDRMPAQSSIPNLRNYEDLLATGSTTFVWPELEENTACALCYTSGTTGNPKGALYSHRSTILHTYAASLPDAMGASSRDVILPVVPMFHVNAWGTPFIGALVGAKLVFPGAGLDGASLYELFEKEKVTFSAGVPTVWLGLLQYVAQNNLKFSTFARTVIGGSACPPAMIKQLESYGVEVIHAWGMTELSPLGTLCKLQSRHLGLSADDKLKLMQKQGHAVFGIDMKIVDDQGKELPWDGKAFGDLMVRGPWVVSDYFRAAEKSSSFAKDADGLTWFATGDVATIDEQGFMQITDRSKDVIKSGGEWISSIDLENLAMAHPSVHEAAVIAAFHPKWDERPLLVVIKKPGAELTREQMLEFYDGKIAKWWTPDDVVFVDEIPHTATGKIQKLKLREQFKDYKLPT